MTYLKLDLEKLRERAIPPRTLFPHQTEAIRNLNSVFDFKDNTGKGGLLVFPTGSGKTFTAVKWLCENALPKNCKVIWLAHSFHLLDQACDTFRNWGHLVPPPRTQINIRVVSSNPSHSRISDILSSDDILILTTPTAISNFFQEGMAQNGNTVETHFKTFLKSLQDSRLIVVLDEAHHAPAYGCRKLLVALREMIPSHYLLGLTATPDYTDETRRGWLNILFDKWIISEAKKTLLQGQKILARENFIEQKTNFEMEVDDKQYNRLVREHKDLPEDIIEKLARNESRNKFIVDEYLNNKEKYGKTLIFSDRWFQCEYLKKKLSDRNIRVDAVYSHIDSDPGSPEARNKRTADENKIIIEKFRNNQLDVLINVKMLTEGTDVPNTKTVFITRQTTSKILLTQMIGRALRGEKAGGGTEKAEANIVFFTDTWKRMIHWASYAPGGSMVDPPPVRGYRPLEIISISLVQKLIDQLNSKSPYQPFPFKTILPIGWYEARYTSQAEEEDLQEFTEFVLVYDFQKPKYEQLMEKWLGKLPEDWEKENLSPDWCQDKIKAIAEPFFNLSADDLGHTLEDDLIRIVRHLAQNKKTPQFFPFEERDKHDLDELPKEFIHMDSLQQTNKLQVRFDESGSLWKAFYKTFGNFKQAYNSSMDRYIYILQHGNEPKPIEPILPDPPSIREPSEAEKEQVLQRDHFICLCCKAEKSRRVKLQVDHIIPFRIGGSTKIENLQTLCKFCNTTKNINEIDFRRPSTLLNNPKNFQIIPPTDFDDFQTFLSRNLNFFYHCGAVCSIAKRRGDEKCIEIELYAGNNPDWFKFHLQSLALELKKFSSLSGTLIVKISSGDKEIQEKVELDEIVVHTNTGKNTVDEDLQHKAEAGDSKAQYELGMQLLESTNEEGLELAIKFLRKAADKGLTKAQYEVGKCFLEGKGTPINIRKAKEYFILAAKKGDPCAQYLLSDMLLSGSRIRKNIKEGFKWLKKAAEKGNTDALNDLGVIFFDGEEGVPQDFKKAKECFEKGAELGESWSMRNLGAVFQNGEGVKKNLNKAIDWYRKAAAQKLPAAHEDLGNIYSDDTEGLIDLIKAHYHYSMAIQLTENRQERGVYKRKLTNLKKKMTLEDISRAQKLFEEELKKLDTK
jgi:ATP-dependent helicase IRC3